MKAKTNDIWVLIDTCADGSPKSVGLELLTPGRTLTDRRGSVLTAVVLDGHGDAAVNAAGERGAQRVIAADGLTPDCSTEQRAAALCGLIEKYGPELLLLGSAGDDRELAAQLSSRLETGLAAGCTGFQLGDGGEITWSRPASGGKQIEEIVCKERFPHIVSIQPGVFRKPPVGENRSEILWESIEPSPETGSIQVRKILEDLDEKVDLESAEIIVAGGRGVGSAKGFAVIEELAETLGASVGASRAAVDLGWISASRQIGITGKHVRPRLYIACGISGSIQHMAGMRDSEYIVAINTDPGADIFQIADYGIVGNLFEILPVLSKEIRAART